MAQAKNTTAVVLTDDVQAFMTLVEESTRSTREATHYFIPPAEGTLERAKSKRHHVVFGRRGSGKSSLLNKIYADHLANRVPCAFVDMEEFKGHSYPDVLVSVLIKSLMEFKKWLDDGAVAPANKASFWSKLTFQKPVAPTIKKSDAASLSAELDAEIQALNSLLHSAEDIERAETRRKDKSTNIAGKGEVKVKSGPASASAELSASESEELSREVVDHYKSRKIEALQRGIIRFKEIFKRVAAHTGKDAYLLLDDLYHIRRSDQASIIDYFHKLAKGANLWIKIGTIRHRTTWYRPGDPPVGMKLGDDAEQIDLDVTLEKYETTKAFLVRILDQFAKAKGVTLSTILADTARDRLVLASGGVARDFLTLFRRALEETRERVLRGDLNRGEKVGAEDVNRAAGSYYDNKTAELDRDTRGDERGAFLDLVNEIQDFCINKSKANCFLIEKDFDGFNEEIIGQLVDLKFIHHVRSRVTVRNRERRLYDAFMLDLSFYTGERARKGLDMIQFWKADAADELRRTGLIYMER